MNTDTPKAGNDQTEPDGRSEKHVPLIGILGGIGSGKSSVVRPLDADDIVVIDADVVGHDILNHPAVHDDLVAAFGPKILKDGQIHRGTLGSLVFGLTDAHQHRRQIMNSIVHPPIREELHRRIASARQHADAVILDASLLLEGNWDDHCDALVFIDTPEHVRQQRVQANRGWQPDELPKRESAQVPVSEKRRIADAIIDNSGTISESVEQFRAFLDAFLDPKRENPG